MADIKRLLSKKSWTGRELGIIELTNMATIFEQRISGNTNPTPLVEKEQFQKILSGITDQIQGQIYSGYISIHEWLSLYYNIALSNEQQAQLQFKTLSGYITQAIMAEDVYRYIEDLPVIMTEKQYKDELEHCRNVWLNGEDGKGRADGVLALIYRAFKYYATKLENEPTKPNPLKPIKEKYLSELVKSPLILSRFNEVTDNGYYVLEDGRRSDQMTDEEWQAIVEVPVKWVLYDKPPKDLTKWDFLSDSHSVYETYYCSLGGAASTPGAYIEEVKDFVAEFKELVDFLLIDVDDHFFKGKIKLSSLSVEQWETTVFSWQELYDEDFYGFKAATDANIMATWNGDKRAIFNGIAVIQPNNNFNIQRNIDDRGYYKPPQIRQTFYEHSLQSFFAESKECADNVEEIEKGREALLDSYYFLLGYNTAIDLIADHFKVPALSVFKINIKGITDKIETLNQLVSMLYAQIRSTHYEDEELKERKLQVLQDYFCEISYKDIFISQEAIEQAVALFEDFRAFRESTLADLLFYRPHNEGENRRDDKNG